jgi:uncharacterized protein YuzE
MASVYFPTLPGIRPDVESLMIGESIVVDMSPTGEVTYLELFDPPDLPTYYPLPFCYDYIHDIYDLFFMKKAPAFFSAHITDQEDLYLLMNNEEVIGMRICHARTRLPNMNL